MKNNKSQKNIPLDWQRVRLGDIGKVSMCKRIFKHETLPSGDVPFYKISTFGKVADSFIAEEIFEKYKSKYPYPSKGEVLISASGTIGRTVVFDGEKSYFQDSNIVWISNPQNKVLNKFLKFIYLTTKWKSTDGGIISRLYNEDLRSIKFDLPPISEQNRIVRVLESWDRAIEKLAKKIKVKKNIKKGLMQKLLSGEVRLAGFNDNWNTVKLGDNCIIRRGDTITKSIVSHGGIPVIAGGKCPAYYHNQYNYDGKTITVSGSGASAGFINYFQIPIFASDCSIIKGVEDKIDTDFVYYLMLNKQEYIYALQSGGAQPHVYPKDLALLKVNIPNLKEQNAIADILRTSDKEIKALESKLSIYKNQKKYLLNNLITGTIRTKA